MKATNNSNETVKNNHHGIVPLAVFLCLSSAAFGNPASTKYVDDKIKEVTDRIQIQLKEHSNTIETKISGLQHQIGESYQGGIVFWVDETKQHGLIAAKVDAMDGQGLQWSNGESGDKTTNAKASGLFAGLTNTQLIISEETVDDQDGQFAALTASQFSAQEDGITPCDMNHACYGNWYLPSLAELALLRKNLYLQGIGGFVTSNYWSSTEKSITEALSLHFGSGETTFSEKLSHLRVRPIHAF